MRAQNPARCRRARKVIWPNVLCAPVPVWDTQRPAWGRCSGERWPRLVTVWIRCPSTPLDVDDSSGRTDYTSAGARSPSSETLTATTTTANRARPNIPIKLAGFGLPDLETNAVATPPTRLSAAPR
jgi:hypothetical protein